MRGVGRCLWRGRSGVERPKVMVWVLGRLVEVGAGWLGSEAGGMGLGIV